MRPEEYTHALTALGLTYETAAEWLGIGRSTSHRYTQTGAPGPVARALTERIEREQSERNLACSRERVEDLSEQASLYVSEVNHLLGVLKRIMLLGCPSGWSGALWNEVCAPTLPAHSDLTAAVGLGE